MNAGGAVNEEARLGIIEGSEGEIDAALEERRRLRAEVVVGGIPEHVDAVGLGQASVVEF
jgi:hypothetical protein